MDLTASGVTTDILGRARPNAGAFDIGAYEDPNLYVAGDTGSDSNNGSMSAPFLTIQKGADIATAGDNVNVKGGITYSTSTCSTGIVCPANSGTLENVITYRNWQGTGMPSIDKSGKCNGFNLPSQTYIKISGFGIHGRVEACTPAGITITGNNSYITISDNIIWDTNYGISGLFGSLPLILKFSTIP
jgi:hypothetical protein